MSDSPNAMLTPEQLEAAPFGTVFADKMAITYFRDGAWSDVEMRPVEPLALHPSAHVLHYSSSCFEGLKAYRWSEGSNSIQLFRLDRHIERLQQSADIMCLPCPDAEVLDNMIRHTVSANSEFVPQPPGALYIRPTLFGTELNVGAAGTPSSQAMLYILTSPVGAYFKGGERTLRILIEDQGMRSTPGFGMVKAGANYASALRHVMKARAEHHADQVLFCPQGDVQETGASNFLLLNDTTVVTKPLNDEYLHGVTRDSVLRLAAHLGYEVIERDLNVQDVLDWAASATGEAALSGTAAVLASVGTFIYQGKDYQVGNGEVGKHTVRLRNALTEIQYGEASDEFGWLSPA